MSSPTRTGGDALVDALVAHGVVDVFGIPGTHNLAVYSALPGSGIRHHTPRHEQGAGYAADGYARASGRPGVCLTTTGPAILNAAAAAAQAQSDSVPVLFVAPGMPLTHPGGRNGLLHEVRDQLGAMHSVVAHAQRATSVEDVPLAVAQCFAAMTTGRPGPAYLEIPIDVLEASAEVDVVRAPVTDPAGPAEAPLAEAADLVAGAERPLVVAGGGASGAAAQVRALTERLGAPVVTTANGKGVLDEDHPLSLGAGVHLAACHDLVAEADLVIAVGTELAPADWWHGPIPATPLVRIDVDPHAVGTNALPRVALVGDSGRVLDALIGRLPVPAADDAAGFSGPRGAGEHVARWRSRLRAEAAAIGSPYAGLVSALASALDPEAVVAADQSMSCYYGLLGNLPLHRPRSFLFPAGLGTLGYALPAAVGAAVAAPDRQVVAVLGDGGLMFSVAELATAAAAGLALAVVVVDNHGYGEIRDEMVARDGRTIAVDLPSPDVVGVATALGCRGVRATHPDEIAAAVSDARRHAVPTVVHVLESVTGSTATAVGTPH